MKEMYAQLGISSEVYDFGHKIEESLKERCTDYNECLQSYCREVSRGK